MKSTRELPVTLADCSNDALQLMLTDAARHSDLRSRTAILEEMTSRVIAELRDLYPDSHY